MRAVVRNCDDGFPQSAVNGAHQICRERITLSLKVSIFDLPSLQLCHELEVPREIDEHRKLSQHRDRAVSDVWCVAVISESRGNVVRRISEGDSPHLPNPRHSAASRYTAPLNRI